MSPPSFTLYGLTILVEENLSILENTVSISVEGVESGQMDDKDVEEARSVISGYKRK